MDLRLSHEQEQLVNTFRSLYGERVPIERVREAEPLGFDKDLWALLLEVGAVAMAIDESAGGWAASPLDMALVAEQYGRYLAPVPMIEAQVAARALSRVDNALARRSLASALEGNRLVTMAIRPAKAGQAALVPGAAVADDAVILEGDRLLLVPLDSCRTPVQNLGSSPLADVVLSQDASELATGPAAGEVFGAAVDEWLTWTAAALAGLGGRALEIAVAYVNERQAWGVPIGSFQAISHPLADSATALDGARLLALEAACAATDEPARLPELAAMAFAFASEAARDVTHRALHFHGGYGFTVEYDIQLYYRRARSWARVFAEPAEVYERVADRRYGVVAS